MNITQAVSALKTERDRLDRAISALRQYLGDRDRLPYITRVSRKTMSAAARKKIDAAQRKRWAKVRAGKIG